MYFTANSITGDPATLSFWITSFTGGLHAGLAVICLVLGPVIFLRRKGDTIHKMLGRIWAAMMLVLNITALMTYELDGRPNLFHAFAILNLIALIPAFVFIKKYQKSRNPKHLALHQELMAWAYFGLAAAGVWQLATSLLRIDMLPMHPKFFMPTLGIATGLASWMLARYLKRRLAT